MARRKKSDEDKALARFCKATKLDDVPLDTWEASHTDLTLTVPIWIPVSLAAQGGEHLVCYCRTVMRDGTPPERRPSSHLVTLQPGVRHGAKLKIDGLGDLRNDQAGDLIVIVNVK
jgi:hypothetical protein